MMTKRGLYIHIPFCSSKCAYCDFYSFSANNSVIDNYLQAVINELKKYKNYEVDTLYIGGGTPSLLGAKRLDMLLAEIKNLFGEMREATVEVNPADNLLEFFKVAKQGGINRVSMGVQSAIKDELALLSRRHTNDEVVKTVNDCKKAGIKNISLDLMLGIPNQTEQSLKESIDFLCSLEPTHISSYILKLEQGTPLYQKKDKLHIPDADQSADLYLLAVNLLAEKGFKQYEISNFCKDGFSSLHNLKYWHCKEYIGVGPSAHGFLDGKRYYYSRNIDKFINDPSPISEGVADKKQEYIMLRLRLKEGVKYSELKNLSFDVTALKEKIALFKKHGLINDTDDGFSLTPNGFLVSNSIILDLMDN